MLGTSSVLLFIYFIFYYAFLTLTWVTLSKGNCGSCEFSPALQTSKDWVHSNIGMRKLFRAHLLLGLGSCWYTGLTHSPKVENLHWKPWTPTFPSKDTVNVTMAHKYLNCLGWEKGPQVYKRAAIVLIPCGSTIDNRTWHSSLSHCGRETLVFNSYPKS